MYISVKTIKGRRYQYLQHSYRDPLTKKPKTKSKYLGPAINTKAAVSLLTEASREFLAKSIGEIFAEKDARDAFREAADNAPTIIGDLKVGEFKQETFDNEAMSQKSAAVSDTSPSSSDGTEQQSDQGSDQDQGSENPGE